MRATDYLINAAFVLIVFRQARERVLDRRSVIIPLAIVAYVAHLYVRSIPTGGNDLVLIGALGTLGLGLGIASGLGIENKPSMVVFLVALLIGLLITPQRRIVFTRGAVLAVALIVVLALLWLLHAVWHSRHADGRDPSARRARPTARWPRCPSRRRWPVGRWRPPRSAPWAGRCLRR